MPKKILFNEAQEKIIKGLDIAADAVGGTLGPKGRNAFIDMPYQPKITNDGATIAAHIELEDKFENLGAGIIRNASSQTNENAGDGTTTTAVLLKAIVHEALKRPENPMEIRASLKKASEKAIDLLKESVIPIKDGDIKSVALISSENEEIANLVVELIEKLGKSAVINVDDSPTFTSYAEVLPGYDAPVGFASPFFINEKATGKAVFEDVHVLVSEKKISNIIDLRSIFDQFAEKGITSCVIVCDDIDDSVLGVLVRSRISGLFQSVVIKAHGEVLEDIEGATGATAISDRNGVTFQNVTIDNLGKAQKVIVDQNKSLFLGKSVMGDLRATELDTSAENEENQYRKKKIKDRAAKLRGGVGVIKIGAHSDFERDYLKLKAEDAIRAVQSALEEGVVEGGGMALWRISKKIGSESVGGVILRKALTEPLRKIVENSGKEYEDILYSIHMIEAVNEMHTKTSGEVHPQVGYDAKRDLYVDMIHEGILDPAKVERCALENAVSAASSFLTTFVAIVDSTEK